MTAEQQTIIDKGGRWYIIHTYSGQEDRVKRNLEQRIETMDVKDKIFDVVVPTEEEIEQPANATTEAAPLDLPSPSLRDELAQLVQEEPDTVVETISEWLRDAA